MNLTDIEIKKELANSVTHLFGILFGIVCFPVLIAYATVADKVPGIIGACIFGFSFLMVYSFSTLYHSFSHPKIKLFLKTMDHISIYFLIAGSYTPFVLLYMFNSSGILLLSLLWGLTLLGIIFKIFFVEKFNKLSTLVYVAMGWLAVVFPGDLLGSMPYETFVMIAAGGISYTVGVIFYLWKGLTYHHAIWHLFVLGGSICHYVAVLLAING
ncbi:MAG: hemolysin III [Maribacter sp.]|jgi:hemolysin III